MQLIFHKKAPLLLLHVIYNEAEILVTIRGNQREIKCRRKILLFLILKQLCQVQHRAKHPFLWFQSQPGLHSLEKHTVRRGETEKLSWQPWRKFTFCSSFADDCWKSLKIQALQECRQFSFACLPTAYTELFWQPSCHLPAIALAGLAPKAGREEKATLRATHLPGK